MKCNVMKCNVPRCTWSHPRIPLGKKLCFFLSKSFQTCCEVVTSTSRVIMPSFAALNPPPLNHSAAEKAASKFWKLADSGTPGRFFAHIIIWIWSETTSRQIKWPSQIRQPFLVAQHGLITMNFFKKHAMQQGEKKNCDGFFYFNLSNHHACLRTELWASFKHPTPHKQSKTFHGKVCHG